MTANVQHIVEQRRLLRNSHCLSASSDSLYLRFKTDNLSSRYPCKHTNFTIPFQERHFPIPLRHEEKQQVY